MSTSVSLLPRVIPWETAMHNPLSRPARSTCLRIVCISDTHNYHRKLTRLIPPCDLLIHAGDFTESGSPTEVKDFCSWLRKGLPWVGARVVIAGNHDVSLDETLRKETLPTQNKEMTILGTERNADFWLSMTGEDPLLNTVGKCHFQSSSQSPIVSSNYSPVADIGSIPQTGYLCHEHLTLRLPNENSVWKVFDRSLKDEAGGEPSPGASITNKITIFGSPYTPCDDAALSKYAFPLKRASHSTKKTNFLDHDSMGRFVQTATEKWQSMTSVITPTTSPPSRLDILVTHGPPSGIRDINSRGKHKGCESLMKWCELNKPRLHIFGHYHASYGVTSVGDTMYVNTCSCNARNDPNRLNKPIVIDLPLV